MANLVFVRRFPRQSSLGSTRLLAVTNAAGEQPQVSATDFADLVREHRPQWLLDIIRSFAQESTSNDEIRSELQKLLNHLRVKRASPKVAPQGPITVATGAGPASDTARVGSNGGGSDSPRQKPTDLAVLPTGAKRAEIFKNLDPAPEISEWRTETKIEEKG